MKDLVQLYNALNDYHNALIADEEGAYTQLLYIIDKVEDMIVSKEKKVAEFKDAHEFFTRNPENIEDAIAMFGAEYCFKQLDWQMKIALENELNQRVLDERMLWK